MKWAPGKLTAGDMIRVRLNSISHFGIFVSENEVIQFGLPPLPEYSGREERVKVISTDIAVFSCGRIVEKALFDRKEQRKAFKPAQIIMRARARMGEGGYNIIHNNCEHFVYECVFGVRYSSYEENARKKWLSRPVLDVYVMRIPEEGACGEVLPKERMKEILSCGSRELARARYYDWKLLEFAVSRSLSLDLQTLRPKKRSNGKWVCDKIFFSLSHTGNFVLAAVSRDAVGIDGEDLDLLEKKYDSPEKRAPMAKKIMAPGDETDLSAVTVLSFAKDWTSKESIYKYSGKGSFRPSKICAKNENCLSKVVCLPERLFITVCSPISQNAAFYTTDLETVKMLHTADAAEE